MDRVRAFERGGLAGGSSGLSGSGCVMVKWGEEGKRPGGQPLEPTSQRLSVNEIPNWQVVFVHLRLHTLSYICTLKLHACLGIHVYP